MPVETPSIFARVIQDHLALKEQNSRLEQAMPTRSAGRSVCRNPSV